MDERNVVPWLIASVLREIRVIHVNEIDVYVILISAYRFCKLRKFAFQYKHYTSYAAVAA